MDTTPRFAGETPLIQRIPLHLIARDETQPRRTFDPVALNELAESIKSDGLIQPIVVSPWTSRPGENLDIDPPAYRLIAGERRWRAHQLAGLPDILAVIRDDLTDKDVAVLQIVENLQREGLTLPELATGCRRLVDQIGLEAAAARLGKSKAWVSQRAGVLRLRDEIQKLVTDGHVTDVEVAHMLNKMLNLDEEVATELITEINHTDEWGRALTREGVREALHELEENIAAEQRKVEREARHRAESQSPQDSTSPIQSAEPGAFQLTELDAPDAPPKRPEHDWERDQRLRKEREALVEPECRRVAREHRRAILDQLTADGRQVGDRFSLSIGKPLLNGFGDNITKAANASYMLEMRGNSDDVGRILDAVGPAHGISINIRAPIGQLRQIETIIGRPLPISEYLTVNYKRLAGAAAAIKAAAEANSRQAPTEPGMDRDSYLAYWIETTIRRIDGARLRGSDAHAAYSLDCVASGIDCVPLNANGWGKAWTVAGFAKIRSNGWHYLDAELIR